MGLFTNRPATAYQVPEDSPVGFLKSLSASIPLRLSAGSGAIYTSGGGFAALRRIDIRTHSWMNFLYPLPF
jgi:hypothetical protein